MPDEAIERERITRIVSDGFASHGYLPVETPLLEEQSSLAMAGGSAVTPFQLFDGDGRLLMVRSDLTMPITRLVATRLAHTEAPIRLRYAAPVVREQAQYMARSRQFTQLGIELIGASGVEADFEVVSMAAETLNAVSVSKWRIVCGSVRPMNELLAAAGIAGSKCEELLSCVHASDFVDLDAALSDVDAPENLVNAIATLPRISGGVEALDAASAALAAAGIADGGVSELRALFESAQKAGFADNLAVDFSVMNSFGYYTGLVFSVYADGVSTPLGSGGRYDEAFSRLGERDLPSAGFALSLEEIEEAVANNAEARPLRIAVPKGSLFADTVEALAAAGLDTEPLHDVGRHLIVHGQGVDYVIVRPTDALPSLPLAEPIAAFAVAIRLLRRASIWCSSSILAMARADSWLPSLRARRARPMPLMRAAVPFACRRSIRASPRRITIELACKPISLRFMATLSLVPWLACPTASSTLPRRAPRFEKTTWL